jgi:hypothetical protein
MTIRTAYAEKLDTCEAPERSRRRRVLFVKSDRPRAIDRYIDYFGEDRGRRPRGPEGR